MSQLFRPILRPILISQRQYSLNKLGLTSVFMQTGLKIRELPIVVKKVDDVLKLGQSNNKNTTKLVENTGVIFISEETKTIIDELNITVTVDDLFKCLQAIPAEKVTSPVAIHALKRIINLNNNQARRNLQLHVSPRFFANYFLKAYYFMKVDFNDLSTHGRKKKFESCRPGPALPRQPDIQILFSWHPPVHIK